MAPSPVDRLIQLLQERSAGVNREDVQRAFDSSKTKDGLVAWTREYTAPECLLTVEECAFFEKHGLPQSQDTQPAQIISDQSFEDAINSIEASTAALEKQSRLLELQKEALRKIRAQSGAGQDPPTSKSQRDAKLARERSQLEYDSNELAASLEAQLRATMKQTDSNTGNATSNVERILEKDDRLLDGLEKILPYLSSNNKDLDDTEEVQRLCQALKACTSDEIRSRMDVAYLDAAHATSRQANGINGKPNKLQHQRESLNAELDELCREIDGLSTMAVDNQYLHPIMQANEGAKIDSDASNAAWTDYMSSTLQYLTSRLDFVGEHSLDQREHGKAIKAMSSILEEVLAATADKTKEAELHPRSPTKQTQRGLKPLRLVQANLSDTQDPASQMLRQLDIRNGDTTNSAALAQQVTEAMKEKEMQLSSLRTSSERSMADQIALSLAAVNTDVQSLMRAIFANSHYGTAHTEGDRVRSTMQALEVETQELGEKMREIDVDNISKALRPKQQKWLEQLKQR